MLTFLNYLGHELRNLFRKPATVAYPAAERVYLERYRGHIENDISKCILCGMCMRGCPSGAITVSRAEYTWELRPFSCVQCSNCVEVCPAKCLSMKTGYTEPGEEKISITHRYSEEQITKEKEKQKAIAAKAAAAKAAATAKAEAAKAAAATGAVKTAASAKAGKPEAENEAAKAETEKAAQ